MADKKIGSTKVLPQAPDAGSTRPPWRAGRKPDPLCGGVCCHDRDDSHQRRLSSARCTTCGCPASGNCTKLIALLRETSQQLQRQSAASDQGEEASVHGFRRRCAEAEERLRRAEREVAELRYEATALQQRLNVKAGNMHGEVILITDESREAHVIEQICAAAIDETRAAGAEAASQADAEAATARSTTSVVREAFRELCDANDDDATGKALKHWTLGGWLDSLGVGDKLADVLLRRLREHEHGRSTATERGFARQLGLLGSRAMVLAMLREAPLAELLADVVWQGAARLGAELSATDVRASRGPALSAKFVTDGGTATGFARGGSAALIGGLDALLDAAGASPEPELWESVAFAGKGNDGRLIGQVRVEHTECLDARWKFSSEEYGVQTTSEIEYWFVIAPEKGLSHLGLGAWPAEARMPDAAVQELVRAKHPNEAFRRRPHALRDYDGAVRELNTRLVQLHVQPLRREELVCARLLTGPMRHKYNACLRALGANTDAAKSAHAALCGHAPNPLAASMGGEPPPNWYPVTLHLINSALLKLGKLAAPTVVYRSLPGGVLPQSYWRPNSRGVLGAIESGVVSCVAEARVALLHAARASGGLQASVLAIRQADGACAADLTWLSQYAHATSPAYPHPNTSRRRHQRMLTCPLAPRAADTPPRVSTLSRLSRASTSFPAVSTAAPTS